MGLNSDIDLETFVTRHRDFNGHRFNILESYLVFLREECGYSESETTEVLDTMRGLFDMREMVTVDKFE